MSSKEPKSKDFPSCFYRVVTKALVVRDGRVLMADDLAGDYAKSVGGVWELPGGGLDFGEDFHSGLRRELQEEVGLTATSISKEPVYTWIVKRTNARKMDWFYALIVAFRVEVEHLNITPSEEGREVRFVSKDELRQFKEAGKLNDQMVPFVDLFNPEDFN